MSGPIPDIAQRLADSWIQITGDAVAAEDFWPFCQVLADAGLIHGQQRDLAAISLGPFKIAVSKFGATTREFIEVLIPSVISSLPAGMTAAGASTGALTAAATCLVKLLDEGVIFRNTPDDILRWTVLVYIKSSNDSGSEPTRADVFAHFRASGSSSNWSDREIDDAIICLLDGDLRSTLGSTPSPLVRELGGRLQSRV